MTNGTDEITEAPRTSWIADRGASLVEYALLLALIAVVCIGALTYFGGETGSSFDRSGTSMFPG